MIVVDASVLADALTHDGDRGEAAVAALRRDDRWAGPEHLMVETAAAVRGRWLGGKLRDDRAEAALRFLRQVERSSAWKRPSCSRVWELRSNLTAYDAAYVAAAEVLEAPLLTGDDRLASVPGLRCRITRP